MSILHHLPCHDPILNSTGIHGTTAPIVQSRACIRVDSKSITSNPCCVRPTPVWNSSPTSPSRTLMVRTNSDLLLLLAATSGLRIRFDHGRRNRICVFFRVLFHRFGLLLLLPFKNVSFKSLSLRQFAMSCDSDHASISFI